MVRDFTFCLYATLTDAVAEREDVMERSAPNLPTREPPGRTHLLSASASEEPVTLKSYEIEEEPASKRF